MISYNPRFVLMFYYNDKIPNFLLVTDPFIPITY
jgi:hypothetical protein